jgi:hypothetical protein
MYPLPAASLPDDEDPQKKMCYLVPELLPATTPDLFLLWPPVSYRAELGRQFCLEFLPSGLFSRLMIRKPRNFAENAEKQTYLKEVSLNFIF